MKRNNIHHNEETILYRRAGLAVLLTVFFSMYMQGQVIHEYTIKKINSTLQIDGRLTEPEWQAAALTERFVHPSDGSAPVLSTYAKFLWDDEYLYVGFICEDPNVWATMTNRDDLLYNGEVVEIICDPDGDGLNYFEFQVNPLGTVLDLTINKPYMDGGHSDISWNLNDQHAAVWVDGTLNDTTDTDTQWTCEVALPFAELEFMATSMHFPPENGDQWRMLVTRYDYPHMGSPVYELFSWDQTLPNNFHVPAMFGRITFSSETIVSVKSQQAGRLLPTTFGIFNYPNPFNPSTTVTFDVPTSSNVMIKVYDILGREITTLVNQRLQSGRYQEIWNGKDKNSNSVSSGVYFVRMQAGNIVTTNKMILSR